SVAQKTSLVAADAAQAAFPAWGRQFFAGTVMVATFGTAAAFILSCPRIYYAMARQGLFFRSLGVVDRRTSTPVPSIPLQGGLRPSLLGMEEAAGNEERSFFNSVSRHGGEDPLQRDFDFRGFESERARLALISDATILVDHIETVRPSRVRAFSGVSEVVNH